MNTFNIRPELTESAFRKWETVIAHAVSLWPAPLVFAPQPRDPAVSTCVGRIRDAILSFKRYNWSPTKIDTYKWQRICHNIYVANDGGTHVRIGPKANSDPIVIKPVLASVPVTLPQTLTEKQQDTILLALCTLRAFEILPTVEIHGLSRGLVDKLVELAKPLNVTILPDNDGRIATLL